MKRGLDNSLSLDTLNLLEFCSFFWYLLDSAWAPCVLSVSTCVTIKKTMLLSDLNKTVVLKKSNNPNNNNRTQKHVLKAAFLFTKELDYELKSSITPLSTITHRNQEQMFLVIITKNICSWFLCVIVDKGVIELLNS